MAHPGEFEGPSVFLACPRIRELSRFQGTRPVRSAKTVPIFRVSGQVKNQAKEYRDQEAGNTMLEKISHFTCRLGNGVGRWRVLFFRNRFFKNHEMLLWQDVEGLLPNQANLGNFLDCLFLCHFVKELDWDAWVFLPVFNED
jgi:hypothetical protein